MKNLSTLTLAAPLCGLTLLSLSAASGQTVVQPMEAPPPPSSTMNRLYLRGDVGGQVTQDTGIKEFFGEPLAPGSKVVFDPGIRFGVAAGYNVTDFFSVEGQTGIMGNRIDSITGASRVDNVFFSNVPLLANLKFQCPAQNCCVTPYFGGGCGMSVSVIDADHLDIGGTTMHGSEGAVVFAYQAFGGIKFRINDNMSVSVEYHYFATTDPTWEAQDTFGTSSDRMKFRGTQTHTASVAFTYTF
jgi:opacity protein-like surface antigen